MPALMSQIAKCVIMSCLLFSPFLYAAQEADELFILASENFDRSEYEETINIMHQLVELSPEESKYHHLLGKAYGRYAENASWFKAMSYAKKCLKSFQHAVLLDDENVNALKDLKSYYEEAPGIVGGSKKKAREIESRLIQLEQPKQAQILQN
jgi:hypothetical protein